MSSVVRLKLQSTSCCGGFQTVLHNFNGCDVKLLTKQRFILTCDKGTNTNYSYFPFRPLSTLMTKTYVGLNQGAGESARNHLFLMKPPSRCASKEAKLGHYATLGLQTDASQQQIKTSYYRLSKIYHPDINKSNEAQDKFQRISEAYEVLSNPVSRLHYDSQFSSVVLDRGTTLEDADMMREELRKKTIEEKYRGTGRRIPRTGKTQIFNYDLHMEKHYEETKRREKRNKMIRDERDRQDHRSHGRVAETIGPQYSSMYIFGGIMIFAVVGLFIDFY